MRPLFVLSALPIALVAFGCSRTPSEEALMRDSGTAKPALDADWTTISGDWFHLRVPPKWQDLPLTSDRRRALVAKELNTPKEKPDVLMVVMRPMPAAADAPLEAVVEALAGPSAGTTPPKTEPGFLAGTHAIIATVSSMNASGKPTTFQTWGALIQGHIVSLHCGGTNADGIALAKDVCPRMVASFELTAPLVRPAPLPIPQLASLKPRKLGSVSVRVPPDWLDGTPDWVQAPVVGLAHTRVNPSGPVSYAAVQVTELPDAGTSDAIAAQLDSMGFLHRLKREPFAFGAKKAVETVMTDSVGSTFFYYDVVLGGTGYEIDCTVPSDQADAFRPLCQEMARSLTVP